MDRNTWWRLELYDERIDGFIHHRQGTFNSVNSDYILALYSDSKGDLWIGTSSGLMLETSSGRFRAFHQVPDKAH